MYGSPETALSLTGHLVAKTGFRSYSLDYRLAPRAPVPGRDRDATRTGKSMDTKAGIDPFFTRESLRHTGAMYLAGADPHQPTLSPAVHADLTGFPPMLLQAGTNEVLLDDSTRMAARARAAGVDVILDITADVPHVFQSFVGVLDEADRALDRAALFLTQHVRLPGTHVHVPGASATSENPSG